MKFFSLIIRNLFLLAFFSFPAFSADEPGEDHPLLGRFAPAKLTHYSSTAYDAVRLPAGPMDEDGEPEAVLEPEGRITWLGYRVPQDHSMLEVVRNYEAALADSDFEILYTCEGQACGNGRALNRWLKDHSFARGNTSNSDSPAHWISFTRTNGRTRIYLLKAEQEELTAHVLLFMTRDWYGDVPVKVGQIVIEGEPMQTGQVEVGVLSAEVLQTALDTEGRAIVEGIFFEHDSAEIRPESAEALEQMARLLTENPDIEVLVVGHTDNQGSFDYNVDLSQRRAAAVRQALASEYDIAGARMSAKGASFMAPIASNTSEQGRELNRRVELVLR